MITLINKVKIVVFDLLFPRERSVREFSASKIIERAKRPKDWDEKDIVALFDYKDPLIKTAIWEMKYKNNEKAIETLAEIAHAEILNYLSDWTLFENFTDPILIPVPLSKEKLEKRGYNQTEILAKEIVKLDNAVNLICFPDIVIKSKDTEDQSSLKTRARRLKNLNGCFEVISPEKAKGRDIIIIDDVTTTGATLKEMKKVLKKSGAGKVKAFAVAH